jgi:DNA-3-methyladenine glycosylase
VSEVPQQRARVLPPAFYRRATETVALSLLGCRLRRVLPGGDARSVIIVETEAYLGVADRAAHTWNGRRTARVLPMWGPGGHAYVYKVYGLHDCFNVVTRDEGVPEAVLIRAGVSEAWWRGKDGSRGSRAELLRASGPGRLCQALAITRELSGTSLAGPHLVLERGPRRAFATLRGPRVGVDYAGEAAAWPLRFAVAGCPAVTARRSLVS